MLVQSALWMVYERDAMPDGQVVVSTILQGVQIFNVYTHTKLWLPSGFVSGVGGAGRGASLAEGIDVAAVEDSTDDSSVNKSSYMNQNTQAKENTKWYMKGQMH